MALLSAAELSPVQEGKQGVCRASDLDLQQEKLECHREVALRFPCLFLLVLKKHYLTLALFRLFTSAVRSQIFPRPANQTIPRLSLYLNTLNHN